MDTWIVLRFQSFAFTPISFEYPFSAAYFMIASYLLYCLGVMSNEVEPPMKTEWLLKLSQTSL